MRDAGKIITCIKGLTYQYYSDESQFCLKISLWHMTELFKESEITKTDLSGDITNSR